MKLRLDAVRSLSFRSLRLRLMVYLLIAGSVPLICALFVFYQQSANYAQREYEQFVMQNHAMIAERMQSDLAKIVREARTINADKEIQQLMLLNSAMFASGESALRAELNGLIADYKSGDLPISDLCFSFAESNVSICSDTTILLKEPPARADDDRIETVSIQESGQSYLRYVAPLFETTSKEVKGYTVFLLDKNRLLNPPNKSLPLLEHKLINEQGMPLVSISTNLSEEKSLKIDSAGPFIRTTANGVFSGQPVSAFSNKWSSVVRWEIQGYAELRRSLGQTAMLFFLVLVLLSATIAVLFSRSVTRPLQVLRSLMKRAELGDLKAYWSSASTQDIDELGESYNQMLNRLEDLIKQVKIEESLKKEKEFEALQYQLNPHFLYNTLNTIKWVAKIHKTPQISEAVSALVRLLQASLGKRGDFLPLNEEMGLVRDYMEIQTFRYGDEIRLSTDIEPVAGLCLVPKLILQPLVENAIIHGLDQKAGKDKQIMIKAWIDRDLLYCQVEDNGKGMAPELLLSEQSGRREGVKEKMSGIGLKHIREKIKLYYGPDYKMLIFSKPNQGTTIRMSLPIHRSEES